MKKPKKTVFINSIKLNNVTRENIKLILKYIYDNKYFEILLKHSVRLFHAILFVNPERGVINITKILNKLTEKLMLQTCSIIRFTQVN